LQWTPEAAEALENLNQHLQSRQYSLLHYPERNYSSTQQRHVVSTTIVVERPEEGHAYSVQRPVYFINEVLSESKVRYPSIQKILYGILITSRTLHHYFDEYKVSVVIDFPLLDILHNRDATGRISKWAVELGALEIKFKRRTATNCQALVYFLAEWRENQVPHLLTSPRTW